jgi:hypothetical protein
VLVRICASIAAAAAAAAAALRFCVCSSAAAVRWQSLKYVTHWGLRFLCSKDARSVLLVLRSRQQDLGVNCSAAAMPPPLPLGSSNCSASEALLHCSELLLARSLPHITVSRASLQARCVGCHLVRAASQHRGKAPAQLRPMLRAASHPPPLSVQAEKAGRSSTELFKVCVRVFALL